MRVISDLNIVKSWGRICGNGTLDVGFTINGPLVSTIFPSLLTRCCMLPTSYISHKFGNYKCGTSRSNDHKRFSKPLQSCLKRFTPRRWWRLGRRVLPPLFAKMDCLICPNLGRKGGGNFLVKFYSAGSWRETNYRQATFIL